MHARLISTLYSSSLGFLSNCAMRIERRTTRHFVASLSDIGPFRHRPIITCNTLRNADGIFTEPRSFGMFTVWQPSNESRRLQLKNRRHVDAKKTRSMANYIHITYIYGWHFSQINYINAMSYSQARTYAHAGIAGDFNVIGLGLIQ